MQHDHSFPGSPDLRTIQTPEGETWLSFRKSLQPHYPVVWRDLAICYAMIIAGCAAQCALDSFAPRAALWLVPLTALWIGFWLHSLGCFGHEAAHYNLAATRDANRRIASLVIATWTGLDAELYRAIHWTHHVHLGDGEDTEISYRNPLSPRFLFEVFTGIYLVRVVLRYRKNASRETTAAVESAVRRRFVFMILRAAIAHLSVLLLFFLGRWYTAVAAWILGLVFYIAFSIIRQILEHRAGIEQQATNRLFGTGFWSRSFGSAGFNRHLLHHWDPAISYTRFDDMEAFLRRTNMAPLLDANRGSYLGTLRTLLRAGSAS